MRVNIDPTKFQRNAGAAGGEYLAGVQSPKESQSAAAIAAEPNYEAGVQAAIARKAFSNGLQKAGDAKWIKGIREKGQQRYTSAVTTSGDEWRAGFTPYAQVLSGLTLAPRGPKGQNYTRVQEVGEALRAAKLGA